MASGNTADGAGPTVRGPYEEGDAPFGARLKELRLAARLTQEGLAERAGLTPKAVSALERGERRRPYPHTVRSLTEALGLSEDERASLLAAVPGPGAAAPAARTAAASTLPAPPTPLVGREREVEEVSRLLGRGRVRLLTLTGTGGVGKTRLAVEAAREAAGLFQDGVAFVALAPLSNPALVVSTIARSLGLREMEGQTPHEILSEYLSEKRFLLILDNFEHVLEAAPEVAKLMEACPNLTVLVTSRAPLRVRGEQEHPVPPLALPASTHSPPAEEVLASASGRLFVERARAVSPTFDLTEGNAAAVAAICWRLAGLPLALELAAAKASFLDPTTLLRRLDQALSAGGARDLPGRQRTMRAALDWSHDLLSEAERALFRRLSVFAGDFTLEAAEAVGAEPGAVGTMVVEGVLEALGGLVEQSLVVARSGADVGGVRYEMLEPIRQYAQERLKESGEGERVRGRHAEYHEALTLRARRELKGTGQVEWMERLGREHDNLRMTMGWLLDRGETERVVEIGWGVLWFWFIRGFFAEGKQWMERAMVPKATLSPTCRAKALTVVGALEWAQGAYNRAAATLSESTRLARDAGDSEVLATALQGRAFTALTQGDHELATASANESSRLHSALGDASGASTALLAAAHASGARGDPARAIRLVDEAEALARESGAAFSLASVLNLRVMFAQLGGNDAQTVELLRESISLSRALRDTYALGYGLIRLAGALVALGQGERAARLYGAAEALREMTGTPIQYPGHQALYQRQFSALREQLDAETFEAAWAEGRAMTTEEAVGYALAKHTGEGPNPP